ncbi:MAG: hypothetical protein KJO36_09790 [Acidimicrobiia bacterium]|nr:hypothetical protein [Acidimicrobiia bacterium]
MNLLVVVVTLSLLAAACGSADPVTSPEETIASTQQAASTSDPATAPAILDIQGHRGARGLQPENTLPAFEAALDLGVTTLEFDLHFTEDGEVVVWHDPVIDASKCGLVPGADGPDPDDPLLPDEDLMIASLSSEELSNFVCDRNPDPARFPEQRASPTALAGDDYGIASLGAVFDFVDAYAKDQSKTSEQRTMAAAVAFNIETKRKPDNPAAIGDGFDGTNPGPFEVAILDIVAERGLGDRVVLQSFDHRSLWVIHVLDPSIRLAALTTRQTPDLNEYARRGASIWSPNQADVTAERIDEAHDLGLLVIPWTINDVDDMKKLIELGVDGLITDRPDLALSL